MTKDKNIQNENSTENVENTELNENVENQTSETPTEANEEEATEKTPEEILQEQLAAATENFAKLQDTYLRLRADFDNFRKNMMREKAELIKNAGENIITKILPVLDDFERAISTMEKANDVKSVKEGVELISQKLYTTLTSEGLTKIDTQGQDFNTDFHEAIAMIPAQDDSQKGKIIDCVQTGYMLNEKVIRHSKVAVGQ